MCCLCRRSTHTTRWLRAKEKTFGDRCRTSRARGSARSENSSGEQFGAWPLGPYHRGAWTRDGSLIAAHNMLWVLWLFMGPVMGCYAQRAINNTITITVSGDNVKRAWMSPRPAREVPLWHARARRLHCFAHSSCRPSSGPSATSKAGGGCMGREGAFDGLFKLNNVRIAPSSSQTLSAVHPRVCS